MQTQTPTANREVQTAQAYLQAQLPNEEDQRILIVDDDEGVRNVLAAHLTSRYECVMAADAQEALVRLTEKQFALALVDVQMPGLSGIELLRKIVAEFPHVAVIMVSVIDRSQRVIDALRLGAFDYLIKPVDFDVLALTVERALERRLLLKNAVRYKQDLEKRNSELAAQKAELERLQAQLVQSEKMASLGQLAGGVAHELNNPAGFIYSNTESLGQYLARLERLLVFYDRIPIPPQFQPEAKSLKEEIDHKHLLPELSSIVADCQEGARRIHDIVLNLRTFSRLDEADLKKIDIHEGIDATIRLLSQYFNSGRITLERDYGDLPRVDCFASQLNQVWMNLLKNAAQAIGRDPGVVWIETGVEDNSVFVRISNSGSGIRPEDISRIFDPFFTTKPVGEGTGLGLSISYGIIEKHGGTIRVESLLDERTTFTTVIPLDAQLRNTSSTEQS